MSGIAYFVGIAAAALVIIVSFELLRRGRLRERHAIWWLAAGGVSLVVSVFPQVLDGSPKSWAWRFRSTLCFSAL